MSIPGPAWVFHHGSLGDSVLLWPVLRALKASGRGVTLVSDGAKASLAAAELGITGVDAEQRRFSALWTRGAQHDADTSVTLVVSFLADPASDAGGAWLESARRMFPRAEVLTEPGRLDRTVALAWAARFGGAPPVAVRSNPGGPLVLHVGAGAEAKRLPLAWWLRVAEQRRRRGVPVRLLAGEVESARFTPAERSAFLASGGEYPPDLRSLAATLKTARAYAGADTGPSHLAGALGVPTVAYFRATHPALWAPIGPRVRVVRDGCSR